MRLKSLLILLALITLAASPRTARADGEVNFDYFYSALQDQGDWFGAGTYGYVFQPRAAAKDPNWRPYADGYWSFTDEGWTWISYEDFGWATYHYGRWAKLSDIGWVWVPGYEWAPAWVSWRSSPRYREGSPETASTDATEEPDADFIGWAPLPPEATFDASAGFSSGVDEFYDIGPANYCFVPTRYFGAPVLSVVILLPARNFFCIGRTVNVTNCYYGAGRGAPRIYCGGPQFIRLDRRVERPIPRFVIERRLPGGFATRGPGAPALVNQIRGNTLQVIAPRIVPPTGVAQGTVGIPRQATPARPVTIKAEIAQPERVRGWNAAGVQPQAVQTVREQFKREAAQAAPQAVTSRRPPTATTTAAGLVTQPAIGITSAPGAAQTSPATGTSFPSARPRRVVAAPDAPSAAPTREINRPPDVARERVVAEQQRREAARQQQQESTAEQQRRALAEREAQLRQQQAAELDRRQQIIAEQQRRGSESQQQQQRDAIERQNAARQAQIEQQRQNQAAGQAQRQQQLEQQREVQAAAQAQRQQQVEAQRQAQSDRQRQAQAEAQARAQSQADAARQQQQEAQRRAAEAPRKQEPVKGNSPTPAP